MVKYTYNKTKKLRLPRPINKKMWGVVARDGQIQTRSLADTKIMSIEQLCADNETWDDYKKAGFRVYRVSVKIVFTIKPNSEQEDKRSVASKADSSNDAGNQNGLTTDK